MHKGDLGYERGCSDAGKPPGDKYINQPDKGFAFHSATFNAGYNQGFTACSGSTASSQSQSQSQGITNNNNPTIIINPK